MRWLRFMILSVVVSVFTPCTSEANDAAPADLVPFRPHPGAIPPTGIRPSALPAIIAEGAEAGRLDVDRGAAPENANLPVGAQEQAIMNQLACVCGSCEREPIATCLCEFARQMRGKVKEFVERRSLEDASSSPATAIEKMIAIYGAEVLILEEEREEKEAGPVALPLLIFGGALGLVIVLVRRRGREGEDG